MATFTSDAYWDDGTARTAGETVVVQNSAKVTIRTDTRWHAGSPASMTGSIGAITLTDGEVYVDGTAVRWLEFYDGLAAAANVPAIGTALTGDGSGAGTLLGVWADLTSAPLTPGVAMPDTGFIKFREVTGSYAAGERIRAGGTIANAVGPEVVGWIEVVSDDATNNSITRLGTHKARGDWFSLADTTGSAGQQLQVPTNGGGQNASGYDVPCDTGVWVETAVGAGTYEFWPALADVLQTGTYTWAGNIVTVTLSSHAYSAGDWVYLTFTSGGGTPNGWYEIVVVPSTSTFVVNLTGSGSPGNVDFRSPAKNGWSPRHLGAAYGETDRRQNFVRDCGNGKLQFGENFSWSCNYKYKASQTGTYTVLTQASTYTWAGDVVTVTYTTGHLLETGHQIYADFTSGDATGSDGLYTITVLDPYTYTFALAGSGAGGNITARVGCSLSITAHGLGVGDKIYCTFTGGGSAVNGAYTIYAVAGTNTFYIAHAPTAGTTGGSVSAQGKLAIQLPATNPFCVGNRVYLDFGGGTTEVHTILTPASPASYASTYTWAAGTLTVTTGTTAHGLAVDDSVNLYFLTGGATAHGVYQVLTVPSTTSFTVALAGSGTAGTATTQKASFDVNRHNSGSGGSGTCTMKMTVGNVPVAGCKTRIPNILLRGCATTLRNKNTVNATLATRPDYGSGIQGVIDFENVSSTWYYALTGAYSLSFVNVATLDSVPITNTVTTTVLNNFGIGLNKASGAAAEYTLFIYLCVGGTTLTDVYAQRAGIPIANGHGLYINGSANVTVNRGVFGIVYYSRTSGYPVELAYCENVTLNDLTVLNNYAIYLVYYNKTIRINDTNVCDRYIGYSNTVSNVATFMISGGTTDVIIDGLTCGFGTIDNQHSPAGVAYTYTSSDITIRNIGSKASPLSTGTFRPNYYAPTNIVTHPTGGCDGIKVQRVYMGNLKSAVFATTLAADYNVDYQNCQVGYYNVAAHALAAPTMLCCNANMLGCRGGINSVVGQVACYGTHFMDQFIGDTQGRFFLALNEPTPDTASQVTVVAGTAKWTGAGQLGLRGLNDEVIIEDRVFRKGHTGFQNTAPTLTGTNTGNLSYEYQIDTGSGYGGSWKTLNGANLSGETISPDTGFKMKMRLVCTSASATNALTFVRVDTTSSASAQATYLYPLETVNATYTLTGLVAGTEVVVYDDLYTTELDREVIVGTTYTYNYEWNSNDDDFDVNVLIWKDDKQAIKMEGVTLTDVSQSVPITQVDDLVYTSAINYNYNTSFASKVIQMDSSLDVWVVPEVYSEWKNLIRVSDNMQYDFAFRIVGGDEIDDPKYIPQYTYLINSWKGQPAEDDYTLNVTGGVLLVDGGGDPFIDTAGAYTVRINYEQPVQAITVSTSGSPITPEDVAAAVWDALFAGFSDVGSFGKLVQDIKTETASIDGKVDTLDANVDQLLLDVAAVPTAAENADAVWDEVLSKATHDIQQSAGRRLRQLASDVIIDGTAVSATSNTIVLDSNASSVNGSYDPGYIIIVAGTGAGQTRIITEYVGASKTAVVNRSWKITPSSDSEYVIMGYADIQSVNEGRATGAGARTLTLNALASSVNDTYKGQLIFITSGTGEDQTGIIVSYDGATRTATIDRDWVTLPDTTSNYVMLPCSPVLLAAIEHTGTVIPKVKTVDVSLVNL